MVELRKARATDTPVCECTICCLGVSEWLYEMVAVRSQWMCGGFPQCTEVSRVKGNGNQQSYGTEKWMCRDRWCVEGLVRSFRLFYLTIKLTINFRNQFDHQVLKGENNLSHHRLEVVSLAPPAVSHRLSSAEGTDRTRRVRRAHLRSANWLNLVVRRTRRWPLQANSVSPL